MIDLLFNKINAEVSISMEEFEYFKNLFVPRKLRKRQYFLQEGDVCRYQGFVEKGLLRAYSVDGRGMEHNLQFALEGWWVADLSSYLTGEPSFLNIEALEETELMILSKTSWEMAMKEIPALEHYFRVILQNHLIATQKRLLHSLTETAEQRYNRFLQTYPACAQRLTQQHIASYVGVTRETISRIRKQMAIRKKM